MIRWRYISTEPSDGSPVWLSDGERVWLGVAHTDGSLRLPERNLCHYWMSAEIPKPPVVSNSPKPKLSNQDIWDEQVERITVSVNRLARERHTLATALYAFRAIIRGHVDFAYNVARHLASINATQQLRKFAREPNGLRVRLIARLDLTPSMDAISAFDREIQHIRDMLTFASDSEPPEEEKPNEEH